jgi:hypothetical protein
MLPQRRGKYRSAKQPPGGCSVFGQVPEWRKPPGGGLRFSPLIVSAAAQPQPVVVSQIT